MLNKFKTRWEIQQNWQLIFPILGVLGLAYSSFKVSSKITTAYPIIAIILSIVLFFCMLKFTLYIFKKLENKWVLQYKWEMIRVFIVFAITGSSSVFVGRPIMKLIGITKENLNPFIYWILFIILGLIFYQILLVTFGWLFGQFNFFWEFEKKMLRRFGLGRFIK